MRGAKMKSVSISAIQMRVFMCVLAANAGSFAFADDPPPPTTPNFSYKAEPSNGNEKYFLVAGTNTEANFAQEIVELKEYLLAHGATEDEIACYYLRPNKETSNYLEDKEQWDSLAEELSDCYPSHVGRIRADISKRAQNSKTEKLFIYFSSHGSKAFGPMAASPRMKLNPNAQFAFNKYKSFDAALENEGFIAIDGDAEGNEVSIKDLTELKQRVPETKAEDYYLTPTRLNAWLSEFSVEAKTQVVVQACYSGQFLNDGVKSRATTQMLTAASSKRPSFGCSPGLDHTFFGESYLKTLNEHAMSVFDLDWARFTKDVKDKVTQKESELGDVKPSEPQSWPEV